MNDDEKTRIIRGGNAAPASSTRQLPVRQVEHTLKVGAPTTPPSPGAAGLPPGAQETRRINVPEKSRQEDDEGNRTRLFRPGAKAAETRPNTDTDSDPVTGWLVVVKGPGKGRAVALGIGHNAIGRDPGQKARIDFGDDMISRENHAIVTFDPKGGKFYLTHSGQGRNLTYLNKAPVLQAAEIKTGDEIEVGATVLRFCAFCSEQFKWDEA